MSYSHITSERTGGLARPIVWIGPSGPLPLVFALVLPAFELSFFSLSR